MKICNRHKIPVLARAGIRGIVGAAVAHSGGVMLNMQTFNKILDYDLKLCETRCSIGGLG